MYQDPTWTYLHRFPPQSWIDPYLNKNNEKQNLLILLVKNLSSIQSKIV